MPARAERSSRGLPSTSSGRPRRARAYQAGTAPLPVELDIDGEKLAITVEGGRLEWPVAANGSQPVAEEAPSP